MRPILLVTMIALVTMAAAGQTTAQQTHPAIPTITFDCLWEAATPQEYTITVKAGGSTTYLSRNPIAPKDANAAQDPDYNVEFTMSEANRNKVFKLAEQANFFNGSFEYTKHAMAFTGKKTLTYSDQARHFQTVYNYSENKAILELTNLFQGISLTLEHARKLQFKHKYDKLGLDEELKATEAEAQDRNLAEMQMLVPALQGIVDDPSVLHIAREKARKLLARAK